MMTTAKIRAARRMITAGTPLTEVASVLGVGRATLYRHLKFYETRDILQNVFVTVLFLASGSGILSWSACTGRSGV